MEIERKPALAHVAVACGVLVLAALSVWQASEIPPPVLQVAVGPAVAPWFITIFIAGCGVSLLFVALRGGWAREQDGTITEAGSLVSILLGLIVNVALIDSIGFILASSAMFPFVARAFGSRRPAYDAAVGFGIALASYVLFDRVLGYKIGSGLIENLI